jgi:hypothetical protein
MQYTTSKNFHLSTQTKAQSGECQKVVVLLGPEEQPILNQVKYDLMRANGMSHVGFVDPSTCKSSITVDGLMVFSSITTAQRAYPNANQMQIYSMMDRSCFVHLK